MLGESIEATVPLCRVVIMGGDADGNLGDRAILQAICRSLQSAHPATAISVVGEDADRLRCGAGIALIPKGPRGLPALVAALASADLVICGGGGLFQSDDSLVKMPYWAARIALARLLGNTVIGYSLGVGPLRTSACRLFARIAFACMDEISVRDPIALATAQKLTYRPVRLVPDPAFLLAPVDGTDAAAWLAAQGVPTNGRPLIGVAPRRWFPPRNRLVPNRFSYRWRRNRPDAGNRRLAKLLAATLDQLVTTTGAHIVFLPSYSSEHEGDDRMCAAIKAHMQSDASTLLQVEQPDLYKGVVSNLDVLLGGRMHPTIFASAVGTPVVGLAYNPKFNGLFELLRQGERVLDVADFVQHGSFDRLVKLVTEAMADDREQLLGVTRELAARTRGFSQLLLESVA